MDIYKPINVLKNFPLDIECIYGYDDFLLVGTKQGTLLHYTTVQNSDTKFDVRLLRSEKSFAKKPINQVAGVPELNIVISLSDGLISVHNLENIQDPCRLCLEKAKGASMFIIELQKLKTLTDEFQYALMLCAVMKRKIMFFYWKKDEFHHMENSDIVLNDSPRTVAWHKETVYVGFQKNYVRAQIGGKMKEMFPVGSKWPEPFVECLSNNRFVLGKDDNTYFFDDKGEPILNYSLNWSSNLLKIVDDLIYFVGLLPNSTVEIKTIEPKLHIQTIQLQSKNCKFKHLTKCANKKGLIYACSASDVFALTLVDYTKQITQLIEKGSFKTALGLAIMYKDNSREEDNKQIDYIRHLQAFDYFCKMEFSEAIKIYSDLKIDPSVVIGLYPDLLPDEFRSKLEYPAPLPELKGEKLDKAIAELTNYLIDVRNQLQKHESRIQYSSIKGFSLDKSLTEVVFNTNIDKLKQIVDTTLLKCYLKTNDALVASLLRLPTNHCHLEEAEKVLKYYNKYSEIIIFYKCRNLHRKALELLQKINSQASSTDKVIKLSDPHLRTKEYLQHLGKDHIDLIFEFAEWMLREYPGDGLKIFIEDMSEVESLPRKQVLDYLRSINSDFVIPYLEHIIYVWKEIDHNLHDALVNEYREKIRGLLEEYKSNLGENQKPAKAGQEPGELGVLRTKLKEFLQRSDYYTAEKLAFFFLNDCLWEERAIVLSKIGLHQEALAIYVYILNDTDKAEEYCDAVYHKELPGNRDVFFQLLRLYLKHLDIENINENPIDLIPEANDNETNKPNLELAFQLLQNYATKMDPISVLNELPDNIPISSISAFLTNIIKCLIHRKHEVEVNCNLLLSQRRAVQRQIIDLHRNKVLIDEHSLCRCCNKRIGRSAFKRYPNQDLIHFACKDAYEETLEA